MKQAKTVIPYLVPAICLIIACFQFYLSSTTSLCRFKGGGFGMYSTNCIRSVWISLDDGKQIKHFQVSAIEKQFATNKILRKKLLKLKKLETALKMYPTEKRAKNFIDLIYQFPFKLNHDEMPLLERGSINQKKIKVEVFDLRFRAEKEKFEPTLLFSFAINKQGIENAN